MISEKPGAVAAKAYWSHKNFGAPWIVFLTSFGICHIKKNYQRKKSTLKTCSS